MYWLSVVNLGHVTFAMTTIKHLVYLFLYKNCENFSTTFLYFFSILSAIKIAENKSTNFILYDFSSFSLMQWNATLSKCLLFYMISSLSKAVIFLWKEVLTKEREFQLALQMRGIFCSLLHLAIVFFILIYYVSLLECYC